MSSSHARLAAIPLLLVASCTGRKAAAAESPPPAAPLRCEGEVATGPQARGNPAARKAAQSGLGFLSRAARAWTDEHRCFGCHVQAVTLDALAVGRHHQYDVGAKDLEAMVAALRLGVTAGGRVTGAAFEGQAWARYDAWIDGQHTGELLKYAEELLAYQAQDGSVPDDDARLPVTGGTMHSTYQAMQTWRQAFARTADDRWQAPMRKAEQFLAARAEGWKTPRSVYLQDVNFALLGLVAAGVGPAEASSLRLSKLLLARQNQDGGWGLDADGPSDALATGQTLYALRLAGHGDGEAAIERGTRWLTEHQQKDGAWRTVKSGQHGAEKGEAMWAVLGLVSLDVTSVAIDGIVDGQHVTPRMPLHIEARDNQAGGIAKVELFVDDRPRAAACGARLDHVLETAGLASGKHLVDVVVHGSRGQVSRRRLEVYAGDTYLVDLGSRFDEQRGATEIALRNLAEGAGRVELAIYAVEGAAGERGARVHAAGAAARPGALTFVWDGKRDGGEPAARGPYVAEVTLRDARGAVVHRAETPFVHDTLAARRARYGEIEGNLAMEGGAGVSANTVVELVDKTGKVVQRVVSTEQGNYRFKDVSSGEYTVRTRKQGFADQELSVKAAPATAPVKADMLVK